MVEELGLEVQIETNIDKVIFEILSKSIFSTFHRPKSIFYPPSIQRHFFSSLLTLFSRPLLARQKLLATFLNPILLFFISVFFMI